MSHPLYMKETIPSPVIRRGFVSSAQKVGGQSFSPLMPAYGTLGEESKMDRFWDFISGGAAAESREEIRIAREAELAAQERALLSTQLTTGEPMGIGSMILLVATGLTLFSILKPVPKK
jgi:hypothetical protein